LVRSVHAATSTITTKKIKDVAMGEVIQIGESKFVKIGDNRWMAAEAYVGTATMQEYTEAACKALPTPTSRTGYTEVATLTDARDGKQYVIRKYADGHCWMAQNLKFGNCAALTDSDWDAGRSHVTIDKVAPGYYGVCRDAAEAGNYDGYLYLWQAAMNNDTAFSGHSYDGRTNGTTEATHDICPLGWHVPTGGPDGEFAKLVNIVEGRNVGSCTRENCPTTYAWFGTNTDNAWNASGKSTFAGLVNSTLIGQGSHARWWSSTTNSQSVYALYLTSNNISVNSDGKYLGFSVRCIQDYTATMQAFTKADCDAAPTPTSRTGYTAVGTLTDARDGKQYVIRKYADGRCWMAQNLQFGNCASITGSAYATDYQSSAYNKVASGYYGTCRDAAANGGNYDGYLYNWQAAINDVRGCYNNQGCSSYTSGTHTNGTTEATHDICPLGWHVPTKEEFQLLADRVQGGTVNSPCAKETCVNAYNFFYASGANVWNASGKSAVAGCAYSNMVQNQGAVAYWWSSSVYSASIAYRLTWTSSSISPQQPDNNSYGFSVRCVADN